MAFSKTTHIDDSDDLGLEGHFIRGHFPGGGEENYMI